MSNWQTLLDCDDVFTFSTGKKRCDSGGDREGTIVSTANKKQCLEICGPQSRTIEEEVIGIPSSNRATCFGCSFTGECESGAVPSEEIMALMNRIRKTLPKTDPKELAKDIAERYVKIQTNVNKYLIKGQIELPDWTAADILDHLRNHNVDSELQHYFQLKDVQEARDVAYKAMYVRNPETNIVSLDKTQSELWMKLRQEMKDLYKTDHAKNNYFSGGSCIDNKVASEGAIFYSGKNLFNHLKRQTKLN